MLIFAKTLRLVTALVASVAIAGAIALLMAGRPYSYFAAVWLALGVANAALCGFQHAIVKNLSS